MVFAAIDVLTLAHACGFRFFRLAEWVIWPPLTVFSALLRKFLPEDFTMTAVLNVAQCGRQICFTNRVSTIEQPCDQYAHVRKTFQALCLQSVLSGEPGCDDVALTLVELRKDFRNFDFFSRDEDKSVTQLFQGHI